MKKLVLLCLFTMFALAIFVLATPPKMPELPVESNLYFVGTPSLNNPADLILEFTAKEDLSQIQAQINIPVKQPWIKSTTNNFNFVDGVSEWEGNLRKGESAQLKVKVIGNVEGYYSVTSSIAGGQSHSQKSKRNELFAKLVENKIGEIVEGLPKNNWRSHCSSGVGQQEDTKDLDYELYFTSQPWVNEPTGVILKVKPKENLSNLMIQISFPVKGIEILSVDVSKPQKYYSRKGPITISDQDNACPSSILWSGDLNKEEVLEIKTGIYVKKTGWGKLGFSVSQTITEDGVSKSDPKIGVSDTLFIDNEFSNSAINICTEKSCIEYDQKLKDKYSGFFARLFERIKRKFK